MIYVAHRENLGRQKALDEAAAQLKDGNSFNAALPEFVTLNSCGKKLHVAAPLFRPTSTTPSLSRS